MLSRWLEASCLGALLTFSHVVLAQVPAGSALIAGEHSKASAVNIAEIGYSDAWSALRATLTELLVPDGLEPHFEAHKAIVELELRSNNGASEPEVWIELISAEHIRLVLADSSRGRYLLRDLELENGLDEIGRETVAQVVESSLLALRGDGAALNRNQLQQLLDPASDQARATEAPKPPAAEHPKTEKRSGPLPSKKPSSESRLYYSLAARYTAQWTGKLGLLHGPGLELGLRLNLAGWDAAFEAVGQAPFSQSFKTSALRLDVSSRSLWLVGGVDRQLTQQSWLVARLGAGVDFALLTPTEVPGGLTKLSSPASDTTWWLRLEAGVELRPRPWRLGLRVLGDLSLEDTHYDITQGDQRVRLVTQWPVRPGLLLSAGGEL